MREKTFISDIQALRNKAIKSLDKGIVTESYTINIDNVLESLNMALATEIVCTLRYKNHYHKAKQIGATNAALEFIEHANQEQDHVDKLSNRITQLGGLPQMNPVEVSKNSHTQYIECDNILDMIKENMIAERIAVDIYRQMIQCIGDHDPTTRRLLEDILAVEEEHTDDLLDLMAEYTESYSGYTQLT